MKSYLQRLAERRRCSSAPSLAPTRHDPIIRDTSPDPFTGDEPDESFVPRQELEVISVTCGNDRMREK